MSNAHQSLLDETKDMDILGDNMAADAARLARVHVDDLIADLSGRNLVPTSEVTDRLLDIRLLLMPLSDEDVSEILDTSSP